MDLSDIVIPPNAANASPIVTCTIEGIIEAEDLRALALGSAALLHPEQLPQEPAAPEDPSDLKKLREKHHSVARMIAAGLTQKMVCQICGYTEGYMSVLLNNPSMQELVELYRIQNGAAGQIITEKLKTTGLKALERLEEKIDGDKLSNNDLIQAAKLGLDRADHGPSSKSHNITEHRLVDHAAILAAAKNARMKQVGHVVNIDEVRKALPNAAPEEPDA